MSTISDSQITANLNGSTRIHVIVGDPIAQVKSPWGMTKKFVAAGHNAMVVPARVTPRHLPSFLAAMEDVENVDSVIVTVPHKFACYDLCSEASPRAHAARAVQCMRKLPGGGWFGENFDGLSFVRAAQSNGAVLPGTRALLVGAGGAGSAIGIALLDAGVSHLAVHDTDSSRRDELIERLGRIARVPVSAGSADPGGFDMVANATPLGMKPDDPLPIHVSALTPGTFVGCVITAPAISPLVAAARKIGCRTSTGIEMSEQAQQLGIGFGLGQTLDS